MQYPHLDGNNNLKINHRGLYTELREKGVSAIDEAIKQIPKNMRTDFAIDVKKTYEFALDYIANGNNIYTKHGDKPRLFSTDSLEKMSQAVEFLDEILLEEERKLVQIESTLMGWAADFKKNRPYSSKLFNVVDIKNLRDKKDKNKNKKYRL